MSLRHSMIEMVPLYAEPPSKLGTPHTLGSVTIRLSMPNAAVAQGFWLYLPLRILLWERRLRDSKPLRIMASSGTNTNSQ